MKSSFWNVLDECYRRLGKGVEYLVEASAAEAEAISATLAAAKARQVNGEAEELLDRDRGAEASPSGNEISSLIKVPDSALSNNVTPPGVRLHHRAVSISMPSLSNNFFFFFGYMVLGESEFIQLAWSLLALESHFIVKIFFRWL